MNECIIISSCTKKNEKICQAVTCPAPVSPGVHWMLSMDPVFVIDISTGDPGDPRQRGERAVN